MKVGDLVKRSDRPSHGYGFLFEEGKKESMPPLVKVWWFGLQSSYWALKSNLEKV